MRKLKLYIASSLDGFIASENGALDWLYEVPNPDEQTMAITIFSSRLIRLLWE